MPHITYGISMDVLTPEQQVVADMLEQSSQLSPGILYSFMIFEWCITKGMYSEAKE